MKTNKKDLNERDRNKIFNFKDKIYANELLISLE